MTIAVIIPCRNEAQTIGKVVRDFREALPEASIVVCDNGSTDSTSTEVWKNMAVRLGEPFAGKGNAVRTLFHVVEADIYLMVDGDDTYDAGTARAMVDTLTRFNLDMVTGLRCPDYRDPIRQLGNWFLNRVARNIFGAQTHDLLSGYRCMSRRFVKSFPCRSTGFGLEPELVMWAERNDFKCAEITTPYHARPKGSRSKIKLVRDGLTVLWALWHYSRKAGLSERNEQIVRGIKGG